MFVHHCPNHNDNGAIVLAYSFEHISNCAVKVLARLAAKKAVEAELRSKGVRVTLVRPAEISAQANAYLASHPELYQQALGRAKRMTAEGVFGKRAQRAYLNNSAQQPKACSDTTISVQKLGAK